MRMILNMRMIRIGDEMMNMRMVLYNSLSNVRGRMPWSSMVRKYGSIKMASMVGMVKETLVKSETAKLIFPDN